MIVKLNTIIYNKKHARFCDKNIDNKHERSNKKRVIYVHHKKN